MSMQYLIRIEKIEYHDNQIISIDVTENFEISNNVSFSTILLLIMMR